MPRSIRRPTLGFAQKPNSWRQPIKSQQRILPPSQRIPQEFPSTHQQSPTRNEWRISQIFPENLRRIFSSSPKNATAIPKNPQAIPINTMEGILNNPRTLAQTRKESRKASLSDLWESQRHHHRYCYDYDYHHHGCCYYYYHYCCDHHHHYHLRPCFYYCYCCCYQNDSFVA